MKTKLKDYLLVTLGCFLAAIGINGFMAANNIVSGGVGGLAVSFAAMFGWDRGIIALAINIPLLILCYFFLGKTVFISTLYGSWLFPIFIQLTAKVPTFTHNQLLGAVFGAIVLGIGLGLVFIGNSSTGGTSIPIKIIEKYTPLSLGFIMTVVDGLVVLTGLIAFHDVDGVLYSIISLLIIGFVVDTMIAGTQSSRNIMIISQKHLRIKEYITKDADRGVTELPVFGGYTGQDKRMLMLTIATFELQRIQTAILEIDPTAFMVVMPANQVLGRGFSLHKHLQHNDDDYLLPM
ncbi:YitT family protein [Streptococcus caprae]|uniref:YitT family protein n=1 Tax=Streptococcus caprae TaxID=1640501 RepID=A0ABV8CV33_9STRE